MVISVRNTVPIYQLSTGREFVSRRRDTDIRTNKSIILDLDETLISASDDFDKLTRMGVFTNPEMMDLKRRIFTISLNDIDKPRGIGAVTDMWVLTRPGLTQFLIFCFSYFSNVCVWSAGKYSYVHAVCDHIFRDVSPPKIIYTFDDCEKFEGHYIKPIDKMNEDPRSKNMLRRENTFTIDDKKYTAGMNPENIVTIPPYSFSPKADVGSYRMDDPSLQQLQKWFLRPEVRYSPDVRELNKDKIFQ